MNEEPPVVFTRDYETGLTTATWIENRPRHVAVTPELIDQWVEDRNDMVHQIKSLQAVATTYQLGRRPNRQMLIEAGMSPDDATLETGTTA